MIHDIATEENHEAAQAKADLQAENLRMVKRTKINLFKCRRVFVPINQGNAHWVFVEIDMWGKTVRFYDSMQGGPERGLGIADKIKRFLIEYQCKLDVKEPPYATSFHLEIAQNYPQ